MKFKKVFTSMAIMSMLLVAGVSTTAFAYSQDKESLSYHENDSYECEEFEEFEEFESEETCKDEKELKNLRIKKYLEEKGFEIKENELKSDEMQFFDITKYKGTDETIIIPNVIINIEDRAFENCKNIKKIIMPCVCRIGSYAFNGCTSLEEINVSDELISIGNCAFMNCESLKTFTVPRYIYYINKGTFLGCKNLSNVILNTNLKEIKDYAFTGCQSIKSVILPQNVNRIGYAAFMDCENLEEVKVTGNFKTSDIGYILSGGISELAFYNCKQLKKIDFNPEIKYQRDSFPINCVVNGKVILCEEDLEPFKEEAKELRENVIKLIDKANKDKVDWSQYNPPSGEIGESEDGIAKLLNKYDGYSSLPKVVDEEIFEKLSADKPILYRGIGDKNGKTGADFANEFRYGKFFNGQGCQGNGTYTTTDLEVAHGYAYEWGDGTQREENIGLLKMCLDDSALIIDYDELYELNKLYKNDDFDYLVKIFENENKPWTYLMDYDLGNLAEIAGYDAIHYNDMNDDFYIILNRGKVIVSDKNVETSKRSF